MSKHLRIIIPEYGGREELTTPLINSIPNIDIDIRIVIGNDAFYVESNDHDKLSYGLRIINFNENVGFAQNVNRIAAIACEDIPIFDLKNTVLLVVNTDVIFLPNAVETLTNSVFRYNNMCGPAIVVPPGYVNEKGWGPNKQIFSRVRYSTELTKGFNSELYSEQITMLSGACFALPANVWFALGGFDCENFRAYYEDDDFGIRMNLVGYNVNICYDALIEHTVSQTIIEEDPHNKRIRETSESNFKKKWPEYEWDGTGNYKPNRGISQLDARIIFNGERRSEIK